MLRGAVIGTGFWANYQVAAWQELQGIKVVAACDRTMDRARAFTEKHGIPAVYDDAEQMLSDEQLDFVDIITNVETHHAFTLLAAQKGVNVICQKPMAPSLMLACEMVRRCKEAGVGFFIHENFRWQAPVRALKQALDSGIIGQPFKARVSFCSAFPVFENQPFLANLDHFILTDIGSHVLDVCRYLFGEAGSVYCLTNRINPNIKGEDVATVLMEMQVGLQCFAEMSYASLLEQESFPQTLILVEGAQGSLHLSHDFVLKVTTRRGTSSSVIKPVMYPWVDPEYAVVHSSIVDCNRDILNGLRGGHSETNGNDNLKTVELVWACYESAAAKKIILF